MSVLRNAQEGRIIYPPITSKLKQKIIRGEYVEFNTLLRENMLPMTHPTMTVVG